MIAPGYLQEGVIMDSIRGKYAGGGPTAEGSIIKTLREKLIRRLRSNSGESFAETLVSLLISVLALTMLAGAISTASGLITKSRTKIDSYQDNIEAVIAAESVEITGTVTIEKELTDTINIAPLDIVFFRTDFGSTPVGIYKKKAE